MVWRGRSRRRRNEDRAEDDASSLEERLIWILGSPRTGSTWLLRLMVHPLRLAANPLGFEVPHGVRHSSRRSVVLPLDEPYVPTHLTPLVLPPFRGPTDALEPSTFVQNTRRSSDPSYLFSDHYAAIWRPAVKRLVLTRFAAQVDRGAQQLRIDSPLIAVKEPNGSHGAELLMSLFARSRLIFLLRDGRDVVNSMVESQLPGGWRTAHGQELEDDRQRLRFVRLHSRLWVARTIAVQTAFRLHDSRLRAQLRYEDLLDDPEEALRNLYRELGVERSRAAIAAAIADHARAPARPAHSGRWREALTDREQDVMHDIMGEKLVELGYPLDSIVEPLTERERHGAEAR